MMRRFSQQRMTLSDLEWPFHASRAISAVDARACCCFFQWRIWGVKLIQRRSGAWGMQ